MLIAGEGPAKKAYVQQTKAMDLEQHVIFVGYLDRAKELVDCYSCADYFVFSSRTETQGLVLLEAMGAGTPVVSVAAMGTRDILLDCPAACIVEDDAQQFAATLIDLLEDESKGDALRASCHSSAEKWSSMQMAEKMLRCYSELVEETAESKMQQLKLSQ